MRNIIKLIVFQLLLCSTVIIGFSQSTYTLTIEQPDQLQVYAGDDTTICFNRPIMLDGMAIGGYPEYLFMWSPSIGLDDPTLQNPNATIDTTTTFILRVIDSENCLATSEVTVFIDPCTGVKDINNGGNFEIYPNPNYGRFNIELSNNIKDINFEIRILNIYGQSIYHKTFKTDSFKQIMEIDIGTQTDGIYIIQVKSSTNILFKRITIL